jgi:sulfur-oxidizing protein SoxZ
MSGPPGRMMSDVGKIRIRMPSAIKAGDIVRVRCLVIHPMERIERDAQGKIIDRNYNYITRVTATYLGKPVVAFDLTQSVSENPVFSFALKATAPGPLKVTFVDTHGGRYEGTANIAFA